MSAPTPDPLPSPGISSRRQAGKLPPKLPLTVFAKKNDAFPDPATIFPNSIIDANVALTLEEWMQQAGDILKKPVLGVVLSLHTGKEQPILDEKRLNEILQTLSSVPITAVIAPIHIADRGITKLPAWITSSPSPFAFAVPYNDVTSSGAEFTEDLKLISSAHVVELDVQWSAAQAESEASWNRLEEVIGKAVTGLAEGEKSKPIVISNLLPPPHSLMVPIVKLLSHPMYLAYQDHISSLSFVSNVYLKFLPPSWEDPTPPSPAPGATFDEGSKAASDSVAKEEWKRRVRMYLGPALEAFGFSRIIFGTSPSPSSTSASTAHDWYNLAREVIAEVGVEQEGVDAIFAGNAQTVYGRKGLE